MSLVKVSSKNQIAVPAAVRRQLGIKPGDTLRVEVKGRVATLAPEHPAAERDVLSELLNVAPELWRNFDGEAYINELRGEWDREV